METISFMINIACELLDIECLCITVNYFILFLFYFRAGYVSLISWLDVSC